MDNSPPPWTMPAWMEPYRDLFANTGGNHIEDLVNDTASTVGNNVLRAALCVAVESQVALLRRLHAHGYLCPAPGDHGPAT